MEKQRTLEGREVALGPAHPHTLNSIHNLAALLYVQGKHHEAEPLSRRALHKYTYTHRAHASARS